MRLLDAARVTRKETMVQITASTTLEVEPVLKAVCSCDPVSCAAKQDHQKHNLKQIALAMHKYHDAHGHFPPAVVIGPDGKTPHSWRVELLPYLGLRVAGDLYQGYKLDEPWDSEHNKQLIEKMPAVYGHDDDSTNAAYFVFTGPGTPFGNTEGIRLQDIVDGTIQYVDARRSQTRYSLDQTGRYSLRPRSPLAEAGGYSPGIEFSSPNLTVVWSLFRRKGLPRNCGGATLRTRAGSMRVATIL